MTGPPVVITFDIENRETTQIEREYAVALETPQVEVITIGGQGPPGIDAVEISSDPDNRLTLGSDRKLYVSDDLTPDPLLYYILARS
ncbi:hypothetical protein [Pseudomonas asplenii]|uniref:Uncharacterized protein n=1 Tax=Pseudomonas asplenii TaxID=53407 RepID=A0A1H6P276_9PSED|nr:hypothetical protein [Pseudomonas fuscovaginae]SEI23599.1 hypothetical protein SAMN05216581_5231 [Pseudomonas fuscovaginae]